MTAPPVAEQSPAPESADQPLSGTTEWPLVGRLAELEAIHAALSRGLAGIVLVGELGSGKTRLAREGIRQAEHRGHSSHWLTPTRSAATIPLGAFAHLLPSGKLSASPLDTLGRISRSLDVPARGRKLVLGVDDAHLLDDLSATLVHQLAGTGRVFVVAVVRSGAAAPDPVTGLWKEGLAERLEVSPLSEPHVEDMLACVLRGPVSIPACQLIWGLSLGNPLLTREIVINGLETGGLSFDGHKWAWPGSLTVTSRLADVVSTALGPLDDDEVAVLEVLAQGEPLEARIMEAMFPAELLSAIERRGLIVSCRDGSRLTLRLASPLHGHVLRESIPELRARATRRDLAAHLAATGARRRGDWLRIGALLLEFGGQAEPDSMLRVADEALAAHDHSLAEKAARASTDPAAALPLGHALYLQGRGEEALTVVADLAPEHLDERGRVQAAALRAQALCWSLGRAAEAESALADPALADIRSADMLASVRAAIQLSSGRLSSALDTAATVLDSGNADPDAQLLAAMTASCAMAASGCSPDALGEPGRWVESATSPAAPLSSALSEVLPAHRFTVLLGGRLEDAAAESDRAYRSMLACRNLHAATGWAAMLGRTTLDCGMVTQARRWFHESLTLRPETSHVGSRPACLAWMAEAQSVLGDVPGAAVSLARAEELHGPATRLYQTDLALARAWMWAADNDLASARSLATHAAADAERQGQLAASVEALHTVVRFGGTAAVTAGLERLVGSVDGPMARAYAEHAVALARGDGAALEQVGGTFEGLGARLLAAEAVAEASVAYFARGRRGRSLSSGAAAQAQLSYCGGARTPSLIGLKVPALTRRERQIAVLAAQGLPSRVIAERLDISVRTVDNHLQVTYGKLGISGRRALATALGGDGDR